MEDCLKQLRWLLFLGVVLAIFSRYSHNQLTLELYDIADFEEKLLEEALQGRVTIENISVYAPASKSRIKEYFDLLQRFENKIVNSDYAVVDKETFENVSYNTGGKLYDLDIQLDGLVSYEGYLYDRENLLKPDEYSIIGGEYKDLDILIVGRYYNHFIFSGRCSFVIGSSDNSDSISCEDNADLVYLEDFEGEISSISLNQHFSSEVDLSKHIKDVEEFFLEGSELPFLGSKIAVIELGIGIGSLALFIAAVYLSSLRALGERSDVFKRWLFTSWMYLQSDHFVDSYVRCIEAIYGVVAYFLLAFLPVYCVWHALQIQSLLQFENYWVYSWMVAAMLLFIPTIYYLVRIFQRSFELSKK